MRTRRGATESDGGGGAALLSPATVEGMLAGAARVARE